VNPDQLQAQFKRLTASLSTQQMAVIAGVFVVVVGILVGSFIGWMLDRWLGNEKPWFFILFFLLGAAAGILNIVRMAMREKKTPPLPSVKDDEDDK